MKPSLFCRGRGVPLCRRHGQGAVRGADDDLRYRAFPHVNAEFGGIAGERSVGKGNGQRPGFDAVRRGSWLLKS